MSAENAVEELMKVDEEITKIAASSLSDMFNAQQLIKYHGENIRWCEKFGGWHYWTNGVWQKDDLKHIEKCAKDTVGRMALDLDKKISMHAKRSESLSKIRAMIELAKSEHSVAMLPDVFDKDQFLLNCQNGIIDLTTGKLMPHDKSKYMTKMAIAPYDPAAQCPTWEWFLNDIFFKNQELIRFMQKAIGYSLTGSVTERCFFICYGVGRNGKGTLLNTIARLLGEYSISPTMSTFIKKKDGMGIPNDVAALNGKRFAVSSELEKRCELGDGLIKKLTGKNDRIQARFMRAEFFEFDVTFKIFLLTNHKPKLPTDDQALWDRVKLIPFTRRIEENEMIGDLDEKLYSELSGILRWAVEGCVAWHKEGLGHVKAIDDAVEAYKEEEDILGSFMSEKCIIGEHFQVSSSRIFDLFTEWIHKNKEGRMTQKEFVHIMASKGFNKEMQSYGPNKGRMFFRGIGLLEDSSVEGVEGVCAQ